MQQQQQVSRMTRHKWRDKQQKYYENFDDIESLRVICAHKFVLFTKKKCSRGGKCVMFYVQKSETSNYWQPLLSNSSTNKNFSTSSREHSNKGREVFYEAVARCYNQDQIISFSLLYTIM
jgi:hypothetical protein